MSRRNNRPKNTRSRKRHARPTVSNYGNMQRPPKLSQGTQVPRTLTVSTRVLKRTFKYTVYLQTMGTQTFYNTAVFTYRPFNATTVVGGSVTPSYTPAASWLNTIATFSYYRVNRIQVAFSPQNTTGSIAPAHVTYQPGTNPSSIGSSSADVLNNSVQNSAILDQHFPTQFTWKIANPSDISDVNGIELAGGWIPTAYVTTAALTTSNGIILFTSGTPGLPLAPTTVYGTLDITYDVSFKQPE